MIKFVSVFFCLLLIQTGFAQTPGKRQARQLQKGRIKEDTSFVYWLPYAPGTTHRMVQGYFSMLGTHRHRIANDFKMKRGTPIHAARGGVVMRVRDTGTKGGLNRAYRPHGNFVTILHDDNSRAVYWHLQHKGALVKVGDTVQAGQPIALSGNTGYTAFPHLHFMVWSFDNNGSWYQIPVRFLTSKGPRYLRPFRKYRSVQPGTA
jgi:murein DD-endopeptidase MepM/ murein hydrolase activator NlpD